MRLRLHPASPFARKLLASIRLRGDDIEVLDRPITRDIRAGVESGVLLETPEGAFVGTDAILEHLEGARPLLVPRAFEPTGWDMDRLLDAYLLEAVVTLHAAPGTPAARAAQETAARSLRLIAARLMGSRWLLGDRLTLPDVTAIIGAADLHGLGVSLPAPVAALVDRGQQVPGLGPVLDEGQALFEALGVPSPIPLRRAA